MAPFETKEKQKNPADIPLSIAIRPGVEFPQWDAVCSAPARTVLIAILEAIGAQARWKDLQSGEDRIRQNILRFYRTAGRAPSFSELVSQTGLSSQEVRRLVQKLRARDLVVVSDNGERITGAYPFTDNETEHRVNIGNRVVHAMCAIDALGVGHMCTTDVVIESTCRATGRPIRITTKNNGAQLETHEPGDAVVWSGIRPTHGKAADTLCPALAFFSSEAALEKWRLRQQPDQKGFTLSMRQGLEVGKAIFGPMLRP
jgi:mercuric reductase